MKYKNLMAKALYDNVPESPEELSFRRGDILTVIEQNTGGLEGWWLCSLHGRQGIAPGNRLKLLIGPMFDAQSPSNAANANAAAAAGGNVQSTAQSLYQVPSGPEQVYQVPGSKVVTPVRVGQSYSFGSEQQELYDVPASRSQGVYDVPPGPLFSARNQGVYDVPPPQLDHGQGVYDVPPPPSSHGVYSVPPPSSWTSSAPQEGNYDFPQPSKHKQEGIYDIPPPSLAKPSAAESLYDFPPPALDAAAPPRPRPGNQGNNEGIYDVPPPSLASGAGPQRDVYDIPRGKQRPPQLRDRGGGGGGVYDIPEPRGGVAVGDATDGVNRLSISSSGSERSSMSTSSSSATSSAPPAGPAPAGPAPAGPAPPDGPVAAATLQRLQRLTQALDAAVWTLQSLAAAPQWRTFTFMDRHGNDVRAALDRVRVALGDVVVFGRAAATAANATAASDSALQVKLRRQLGRLEDSQQVLTSSFTALENCSWALSVLVAAGNANAANANAPAKPLNRSDDLDRFVTVSRTVPDDVKQLAATVSANAELLFRRTDEAAAHQLPCPPAQNNNKPRPHDNKPRPHDKDHMTSERCVKSWMEDYDYVHLQGKDEFERHQKELLEQDDVIKNPVQLGPDQISQFKKLQQEVIRPVENDITRWSSQRRGGGVAPPPDSSPLGVRDRQLLSFYAEQCEQHFVTLLSAVDAFFGCVGAGQPPRIFVAHSKFVILSAHKLVFIGDTLSRQAAAPELANAVMNSSNVLCDLLKTVVAATKMAALNYPNTGAVQEMVDRVTALSHHAQQFKEKLLLMSHTQTNV